MSAFRDLLEQVHAKGIRFVSFHVDMKDFFADEQNEAWRAETRAQGRAASAQGRTGEEALRHLVERL